MEPESSLPHSQVPAVRPCSEPARSSPNNPVTTHTSTCWCVTWCFSDRASWIDYTLITNLMHWLLFIHKMIFSSTYFEPQVLIFRRIQLYTCSVWYSHSLWDFLVACRYTAWVRILSSHSSCVPTGRGELSYLAPLGSENISAPYFKQCFFQGGGGYYPPDWVKNHASQSQDRNNKYFILYIEFYINNKI